MTDKKQIKEISQDTDTFSIRLARPEDAHSIALFSRESFYETFAAHNTASNMEKFMNGPFSMEILEAQVREQPHGFLLAEQSGGLLGYVRLIETPNPPQLGFIPAIEIARIYVKQGRIGKGVGSALMQAAIDTARGLDKEVIWLGVWEQNERAIRFYQSRGFEKFGTHVFMLGDDAQTDWLMKKSL